MLTIFYTCIFMTGGVHTLLTLYVYATGLGACLGGPCAYSLRRTILAVILSEMCRKIVVWGSTTGHRRKQRLNTLKNVHPILRF